MLLKKTLSLTMTIINCGLLHSKVHVIHKKNAPNLGAFLRFLIGAKLQISLWRYLLNLMIWY